MKDETFSVQDFQKSLEDNRNEIANRRLELYKTSGRFVPASRKKWLKTAVRRRRRSQASS